MYKGSHIGPIRRIEIYLYGIEKSLYININIYFLKTTR